MSELLKKILPEVSLLGGLNDEELEKVAGLLTPLYFKAGDVIAHKDEIASQLFILAAGRCRVSIALTPEQDPLILAELSAGACVGEMALVDMQPRGATVTAITDAVVYALSNADFLQLYDWNVNTYTVILSNMARELSRRLRTTNRALAQLLIEQSQATQSDDP